MEVAGLVLGIVPVAIEILQDYQTAYDLASRCANRYHHVESLIRALRGHEYVLEETTQWILTTAGIYKPRFHDPRDVALLLQTGKALPRLNYVLGEKGSGVFQDALLEAREALLTIVQNVKGFIPEDQVSDFPTFVTFAIFPIDG